MIIPQRRCLDVFCHPPTEASPPADLPALRAEHRRDIALLLPHTSTDPHLAAMVQVAPDRLKRGDCLWVFHDADQLVHVAWTRFDRCLDLTYELGTDALWPLPEASIVIYDCYTLFAARGHHYYPRALATMVRFTPSATHWIYALRTNIASCRGIARAGFVRHESHCRWQWPLLERLALGKFWPKRDSRRHPR
jgi:hypothetical protein